MPERARPAIAPPGLARVLRAGGHGGSSNDVELQERLRYSRSDLRLARPGRHLLTDEAAGSRSSRMAPEPSRDSAITPTQAGGEWGRATRARRRKAQEARRTSLTADVPEVGPMRDRAAAGREIEVLSACLAAVADRNGGAAAGVEEGRARPVPSVAPGLLRECSRIPAHFDAPRVTSGSLRPAGDVRVSPEVSGVVRRPGASWHFRHRSRKPAS